MVPVWSRRRRSEALGAFALVIGVSIEVVFQAIEITLMLIQAAFEGAVMLAEMVHEHIVIARLKRRIARA